MGKIYVIANGKGGCAKTTTTCALASGLTRCGYKTLVVDMDPQGNSTDWARVDTTQKDVATIVNVLVEKIPTAEAISKSDYFDIIPAAYGLRDIEEKLSGEAVKEFALTKKLEEVAPDYDFVLIDTPPGLPFQTKMAFFASTGGIIIVSDSSHWATKGMAEMSVSINAINDIKPLDIQGILIARVNPQTTHYRTMQKITKDFGAFFDAKLYEKPIRQTTVVMNAQLRGVDLFDNPRVNPAVADYKDFVIEFLEREGFPRPADMTVFDAKKGKKND